MILAALACFASGAPVAAAPLETSRLHLVLDVRAELGQDDVAGLDLGLASLGVRWRIAPTLALDVGALGLLPIGASDDGRPAHGGIGGELALRVMPWPESPVRPWLRTSAGLLFFGGDAPFLPGGDIYEGVLTWGIGADVSLGRVALGFELHYVHLSNGQGLGPHNPAFDGVGGSLSLSLALTDPTLVHGAWDDAPARDAGRSRATPGLQLDASYGSAGEARIATARVRMAQRLTPHGLVLLDVESGVLAGHALVEAGLALVAHVAPVSLGFHIGGRDYAGLGALVAVAQVELHATDEITFVAMGQLEDGDFAGTAWRAAVGLRAFPARSVIVDVGVGFDRIGEPGPLADTSDPYLGFAWLLPIGLDDWQVSLFVERQVSTVQLVGVRVAWGFDSTLRAAARNDGWARLR